MPTYLASKTAGGTLLYMPPELFRNGHVSTKWDVWSLGVIIVEMLTGHYPFCVKSRKNEEQERWDLEEAIKDKSPDLQGLPSEWIEVVNGCLNKDYNERWTAGKVLTEIEGIGLKSPTISLAQQIPAKMPLKYDLILAETQTIPLPQTIPANLPLPKTEPAILKRDQKFKTDNSFSLTKLLMIPVIIGIILGGIYLFKPVGNKTAEDFFNEGYSKQDKGDNQGALSDYNEAIRINPNYVRVYARRGILLQILGQPEKAKYDFQKAISLEPI